MDLASKYAPKTLAGIIGNSSAVEEVRKWALDWERGKKPKPLLFVGSSGVGKTAAARAVASEFSWALAEVTRDNFEDFNGIVRSTTNLFGGKTLVLVDAVDEEFTPSKLKKMADAVAEAGQPVIFVSRKSWTRGLAALKPAIKKVSFRSVNWMSIRKRLVEIAEAEGIDADAEGIARACGGDVRAAYNDLSSGAGGTRLQNKNVFSGVIKLFKTESFGEAVESADAVDENLDYFLLWVEENIHREYEDAAEVAKAFDALSRADVYRGRIRRRQNWKLLKYVRSVGLGGVALAKKGKYRKMPHYAFPSILKKLSTSKKKRAVLKSLSAKVGEKLHCSGARARECFWAFAGFGGAPEYFGLDADEKKLFAEFG